MMIKTEVEKMIAQYIRTLDLADVWEKCYSVYKLKLHFILPKIRNHHHEEKQDFESLMLKNYLSFKMGTK